MAADRGDQQHQHGGVRDRLEGDAVEIQADRGDDRERQRDIDGDASLMARQRQRCAPDRQRQRDVDGEAAQHAGGMQRFAGGEEVEAERHHAHRDRQPDRARHLAGRQAGIGQRAKGDELALRDQDHPRHREHQHQRQAEQRVNRAVGYAVLQQEQQNGRVQGRSLPTRVVCAAVYTAARRSATAVETRRIFSMVYNDYRS